MLILDLFEELEGPPEPTLIDALRDFLPLAIKHLELKKLPKIKLLDEVETEYMPSFGKFSNDDHTSFCVGLIFFGTTCSSTVCI